jgi:hypothetical protein
MRIFAHPVKAYGEFYPMFALHCRIVWSKITETTKKLTSSWPQHAGDRAGEVARETKALTLKEHEFFIQSLLEQPCAEAGHRLERSENLDLHSLARFRTSRAAFKFVQSLYGAGAEAVIAAVIYNGKNGKEFADHLLIELPKAEGKRTNHAKDLPGCMRQTRCRIAAG